MPSFSERLARASLELAARQWKALGVRLAGPALRAAKVPRWELRFAISIAAWTLAVAVESKSPIVRSVEARRFVETHGQTLAWLGLTPPPVQQPEAYFEQLMDWLLDTIGPG